MPVHSTAFLSLVAHLDRSRLRYEVRDQAIVIKDSLNLSGGRVLELPDHLTVEGFLGLHDTGITRLPQGLVVQGDLNIDGAPLTFLPKDLSVGQALWIKKCRISTIPPGFRIGATLKLSDAHIKSLPEGLVVGDDLLLWGTSIRRLPKDMHVGGMIGPPGRLDDVQAFMHDKNGEVVLQAPQTQHERMELRLRLDPFPDLWRVMNAAPAHMILRLRPRREGGYSAHLLKNP
ncbi:MAG: hypothetical protein ACRYGG_12520 [Janthinobacterium lividum]